MKRWRMEMVNGVLQKNKAFFENIFTLYRILIIQKVNRLTYITPCHSQGKVVRVTRMYWSLSEQVFGYPQASIQPSIFQKKYFPHTKIQKHFIGAKREEHFLSHVSDLSPLFHRKCQNFFKILKLTSFKIPCLTNQLSVSFGTCTHIILGLGLTTKIKIISAFQPALYKCDHN